MWNKKTLEKEWEGLTRELYPEIAELGNTPSVIVTPTNKENDTAMAVAAELNSIILGSRNEIRHELTQRLIGEILAYDNGAFLI